MDPETLGLLASTGTEKGNAVAPYERIKKISFEMAVRDF
jgi:hypothetical protein